MCLHFSSTKSGIRLYRSKTLRFWCLILMLLFSGFSAKFNKILNLQASVSSLFMPEPEDAVAHGDANLAVDDFLARNSSIS